ncbi:MAG: hypothetical protein IPL46_22605 [Saprospiraceae bacterium]|nr:hypothetical protein [Saprospiraceae bacterium]
MRYLLSSIIVIHGLIHLMGFAKAFGYAELPQITRYLSKGMGILWLLTTLFFLITAISFVLRKDFWWMSGLIAVILSQTLIFLSWESSKFGSIANIIILLSCLVGYSTTSFKRTYQHDVSQILSSNLTPTEEILTEKDIKDLPALVQNYIRLSGSLGKPKVKNFKIEFDGKIRKNTDSAWMKFSSEQYNSITQNVRLFSWMPS